MDAEKTNGTPSFSIGEYGLEWLSDEFRYLAPLAEACIPDVPGKFPTLEDVTARYGYVHGLSKFWLVRWADHIPDEAEDVWSMLSDLAAHQRHVLGSGEDFASDLLNEWEAPPGPGELFSENLPVPPVGIAELARAYALMRLDEAVKQGGKGLAEVLVVVGLLLLEAAHFDGCGYGVTKSKRRSANARWKNSPQGEAKNEAAKLWPEANRRGWTAAKFHTALTDAGHAVPFDTARKWLTALRKTGSC